MQFCPNCKKEYSERPALSREDNKTEICPRCGIKEAIDAVKAEIKKEEDRLRKIAEAEENDPVLIEGRTIKDFYVQIMDDPKAVAKIMLDFDYPRAKVLGEEPSQEMWDELACRYGLESICSVDL